MDNHFVFCKYDEKRDKVEKTCVLYDVTEFSFFCISYV